MQKILKNSNLSVISTESLEVFKKFQSQFSSGNPPSKIVGTHSGCFHADEVLSVAMIKYLPEFRDMWVIRSRNKEILNQTDILVDVGGVYDAEKLRFDHHMRDFNHVHDDVYKIKLSSAGLIFKHFGLSLIKNVLLDMGIFDEKQDLKVIYDKLYVNFIAYVDGQDNGISQYSEDVKPKYSNTTCYGNRVMRLNPEWNEPNADQSERFKLALDVAESELLDQIKFIAKVYLPGFSIVKEAVLRRFDIHESGRILYFDIGFPWKSHLTNIEEEMKLGKEIVFAIVKNGETDYRVGTIPVTEGSFKFRKGLLKDWRGLEISELAKISGIEDIVFVHTSGFIGGAKSLESAMKMAVLSLQEKDE